MNRLIGSLALLLAFCGVTYGQAQTPATVDGAGEMKPMALLTISGYDELKEDINFLGSLAGQPQLAAQFEPFIMGFVQGLNKTQPLGVVLQTDGMNFAGAICLPIADFATFLKNLKAFGIDSSDAGEGITQISANGQTLFGKQGNGWAFLSMMPQMLENLPADPAKIFSNLSEEYDLGVRANIQNIPEAYRQMLIQNVKAGMDAGMRPMQDESDEQFETRKAMATAQVEQIERMIKEIDEVTVGLSVDNKQQRTFLDIAYTAVAGSKLSQQLAEMADTKTNFAGFFQPNAAGMLMLASKMQESDIAQMQQMFGAFRKQVETAIDKQSDLPSDEAKETAKSAANDFMDAMLATLTAGTMDGGAVLNLTPESLSFVAGGFIGDPAKVESGLKKLAELGKDDPKMPAIKWNAASHDGVNFHTLSVPTPDEEEPRQLFGETVEMAVGIGKQSVYFSLGRDCIATAKKIIEESAANPGKAVAPMEMSLSIGQILKTVATFEPDDETLQMVSAALENETSGRDHVRIVAQPIDNGVRSRFEIEEGVMRAIGVAAKAQQMQAAGAPR
ncbi:hypothetical protein [Bythopirellula polymerisocia]|nr:hypothetical protein [Bythopirellula polymerisocia]